MSYYTEIHFLFSDEPPPFEIVEECARVQFASPCYSVEHILADLRQGWSTGKAEFNRLDPTDLISLMCCISAKTPGMSMCMRGYGEEWRDVWLREFADGEVTFSGGPFFEE